MKNIKKIVFPAILLLILIGAVCAANSRQILSAISGIKASDAPVITNAFIDKEKYFPGDQMTITAETKNALGVKAFVENEAGFNEVALVVMASFEGKETWSGKWKVENSLTGKIYKLKIVASNKSGTTETVLEWEDPNPGHPWSQIDNFPAACGAGQFVRQIGDPPTCATPATFTGCASAVHTSPILAVGNNQQFSQECPAGKTITGGGCSIGAGGAFGEIWDSHPFANKWWCTFDIVGASVIQVWAICC